MKKHIFLTGFMGSGKTTLAKRLAQSLNLPFIDTDLEIERECAKSISDIFQDQGEKWFREMEEKQIEKICRRENPAIISLGGGALMSKKNLQKVLSAGTLIYIKISPEEIYKRVYKTSNRPLLHRNGRKLDKQDYLDKIDGLLKEREEGYHAAHIVLNNDNLKVDQAVDMLVAGMKG
jgi:shikimate kinase